MCLPYWFPKPDPECGDAWGKHCMLCGKDWVDEESCERCEGTYDKLKARGELPRRREAVLATREALSATLRR
jgi:hypothetical protein